MNLRMFGNLCGGDATRRVILATTMWGRLPNQSTGIQRERELINKYWKGMIDRGSATTRFLNNTESAWAVLDIMLKKESNTHPTLLLQEELVDLQMKLSETQAGKTLYEGLQKQLAQHKLTLQELRAAASDQSNQQLLEDLEKQCDQAMERVRDMMDQIKEMKIPLGRRILSLFTFRRAGVVSILLCEKKAHADYVLLAAGSVVRKVTEIPQMSTLLVSLPSLSR